MSTKIHATVDALGNPTGFHLTGGQEHDLAGADALLPGLEADALIADKAFDADQRVLEPLAEAGKTAVIPPRKTRTTPRAFDKDLYKARHLIETSPLWNLSRRGSVDTALGPSGAPPSCSMVCEAR